MATRTRRVYHIKCTPTVWIKQCGGPRKPYVTSSIAYLDYIISLCPFLSSLPLPSLPLPLPLPLPSLSPPFHEQTTDIFRLHRSLCLKCCIVQTFSKHRLITHYVDAAELAHLHTTYEPPTVHSHIYMSVSEPDPRKIEKEGLVNWLGWKSTLCPVCRRTSNWLLISILMCVN